MKIPGEERQADGGRRDERSAPRFDPRAGMRVMADIQAEGLRAAGELLERVLTSEPQTNGRAPSRAYDYTTLVDVWGELLRQTLSGLAPGGPVPLTASLDGSGAGPQVRLTPDESTAEVRVHNGGSSAAGPLVLRCGELRSSAGKKLKGAKVRLAPRKVESLPARSSAPVTVSLVTQDVPRPGIYRGTIQAKGAPQLWLPLEVVIEPC